MHETEALAHQIVKARFDELPAQVIEKVKTCFLDTIACGLGGHGTSEVNVLVAVMKDLGGPPEATIIGQNLKLPFIYAAQVNRVLADVLGYDDIVQKLGHMSSVFIPVALAVGEKIEASGKEIINAVTLGCESVLRLREAVHPSEEAFWKTFERVDSGVQFGVTVVTGKLLGLDAGQMADALGLTRQMRGPRISQLPPAGKGMPAWMRLVGCEIVVPGIQAVLIAKKGFPGDRTVFDEGRGYGLSVGSDRYEPAKLLEDFGRRYMTLNIAYKYYPSCRHASSTLDAVADIVKEREIKPEDVETIQVKIQKHAVNVLSYQEPAGPVQAQFSLPHLVTMIIMGQPAGPAWFTKEMLNSESVREFRHKVKIEEDADAARLFYNDFVAPSSVNVKLKDGRFFAKQVMYARGELMNPFSAQDHVDKLFNMATVAGMRHNQAERLLETVDHLEALSGVSMLTDLLVPGKES